MASPYRELPAYCFWRKAVSNVVPFELDPVTEIKFKINSEDKVATAGSCFAQHISRSLQSAGFKYYVAEPGPAYLSQAEAERLNFGVYSARYGNIYTVRQLLQLFDRAFGVFFPTIDAWENENGCFVDPYRAQISSTGFSSIQDLLRDKEGHLVAVRKMFETLDVFVFTLGLTEGWRVKRDGAVLSTAPGVVGGTWDREIYEYVNFDIDDIRSDLDAFVARLKAVNSRARILVTVSPVPLIATYEDRHVLSSTIYSKSVLRVAAEHITRKWDNVMYFPSYEIISGGNTDYFENDRRSVSERGVRHVMRVFHRHMTDREGPMQLNRSISPMIRKEFQQGAGIVCDEEILDQGGRQAAS